MCSGLIIQAFRYSTVSLGRVVAFFLSLVHGLDETEGIEEEREYTHVMDLARGALFRTCARELAS